MGCCQVDLPAVQQGRPPRRRPSSLESCWRSILARSLSTRRFCCHQGSARCLAENPSFVYLEGAMSLDTSIFFFCIFFFACPFRQFFFLLCECVVSTVVN